MISITNGSNYLAQIVILKDPKKHPNADKLQIWDVGGQDVITDLSAVPGKEYIFFPAECQVHHTILSKLGLYSTNTLNEDTTKVGYVSSSRRVKATKLRGVISEGMLLGWNEVMEALNLAEPCPLEKTLFDTVKDIVICNKYVPQNEIGTGSPNKKHKQSLNSLLVRDFPFHYDTSKFVDNQHKFTSSRDAVITDKWPSSVIVITDKWHGTSAVFSNLLVKKKLPWIDKVKKFFGKTVVTEEYRKMYASRSVLKSIEGMRESSEPTYFKSDIWKKVFDDIKDSLFPGDTIYGEIVGYQNDTKLIQPQYDYGCKPGEYKFVVYRMTHTYSDGTVDEYGWHEIQAFCSLYGLETVKELYYGTIENFLLENAGVDAGLLDTLKSKYLEKDCQYCVNKVPSEGICIRNESLDKKAYKLKSKLFLLGESNALDSATEVLS